jgi:peroxiredoxin
MKYVIIILLLILNLSFLSAQEKTDVNISPEKPLRGGKVTITYNPEFARLKNPRNLIMIYGDYATFFGRRAKMIKNGNLWQTALSLNDEKINFLAFYFVDSSGYDDNKGKQYCFPVYKNDEIPVENAFYYKARFLRALSVYDYSKNYPQVISTLEKELLRYPNNIKAKKWFRSIAGRDDIQNAIKNKKINFDDIPPFTMKDKLRADSINKGYSALNKIVGETDEETKKILCDNFVKEFKDSHSLEIMYRFLFEYYNKKDSVEKMFEAGLGWIKNEKRTLSEACNEVAWALAERGINLNKALELSIKSLDVMDSDIHSGGTIEGDSGPMIIPTPENEMSNLRGNRYMKSLYLDTKGWIYFKMGDLFQAEKLIKEAISNNPVSYPLTNHLIRIYEKTGSRDSILPLISGLLENDFNNEPAGKAFKKHYIEKFNSEAGYEERLKTIEAKYHERIRKESVLNKMDRNMPDFILKTDNGESLNTTQERGKVIFLNFYETLGSGFDFQKPYIEKIYQNYKDRKDFRFLAVNCGRGKMETRERNEKILKEKNISFPTAYDENNNVSKLYGYLLFSHMQGYDEGDENRMPVNLSPPAYFIIDKSGKCQYCHGMIQNPDQTFERIDAQIEYLLNEK